ncbi:FmdB family zinc ribbon protein [Treponema endosymbiont of Eucomonympha sp.]|uniref:FmdB family zinc ribbon protein n=1 Tax=Treponema endosymbiont of Eucomonympha sp. TaxID=1580831 RepID=UPI0007841212|nr:FmdB family zinc ribbon protein [Treponema endosymbiont of Eucomonympha sp.]
MPVYEYECEACAHRFEASQKMSDAPLSACPVCKQKARRVFSGGFGVSFHGSGFYATDSKKPKQPEKPAAEKKPACPAECSQCPHAAAS